MQSVPGGLWSPGGENNMTSVILFWYLVCNGGTCTPTAFTITHEAAAIVACESGDGEHFGTYSLRARSKTKDGGLFQFNDKTYKWLTGKTHADVDSPDQQYAAFKQLWNDGRGWKHWTASQKCWSKWIVITDNVAEWNTNASLD